MAHKDTIPDEVLDVARRSRDGSTVVEAWHLHSQGGLTVAAVARRLDVPYRTAVRWIREIKDLLESNSEGGSSNNTTVSVALFDADRIARERAWLYEHAKEAGKLDVAQRALDSEQRRLGLDVQRIEQRSFQVTVQHMAPEERREELRVRLARLAERDATLVEELAASTGGAPPKGGHGTHSYNPPDESDEPVSNDAKVSGRGAEEAGDVSDSGDGGGE